MGWLGALDCDGQRGDLPAEFLVLDRSGEAAVRPLRRPAVVVAPLCATSGEPDWKGWPNTGAPGRKRQSSCRETRTAGGRRARLFVLRFHWPALPIRADY